MSGRPIIPRTGQGFSGVTAAEKGRASDWALDRRDVEARMRNATALCALVRETAHPDVPVESDAAFMFAVRSDRRDAALIDADTRETDREARRNGL